MAKQSVRLSFFALSGLYAGVGTVELTSEEIEAKGDGLIRAIIERQTVLKGDWEDKHYVLVEFKLAGLGQNLLVPSQELCRANQAQLLEELSELEEALAAQAPCAPSLRQRRPFREPFAWGRYAEDGFWVPAKHCLTPCHEHECDCGPPNGQQYNPNYDQSKRSQASAEEQA